MWDCRYCTKGKESKTEMVLMVQTRRSGVQEDGMLREGDVW